MQMSNLANYAMVTASFALAQLCCVALYLLAPERPGLFAAGCALALAGLYCNCAFAVVYHHAQPKMARTLVRIAEGDLSLHCYPGWNNVNHGQTCWTALNK